MVSKLQAQNSKLKGSSNAQTGKSSPGVRLEHIDLSLGLGICFEL
jgi:hypothetical protein